MAMNAPGDLLRVYSRTISKAKSKTCPIIHFWCVLSLGSMAVHIKGCGEGFCHLNACVGHSVGVSRVSDWGRVKARGVSRKIERLKGR